MSEQWGTTGRVTLTGDLALMGEAVDVRIDNDWLAGWVGVPDAKDQSWWAYAARMFGEQGFPPLDAAVMWVLRRTAPDVWRAERPVVYSVARAVYGTREHRWWSWVGANFQRGEDVVPLVLHTFSDAIYCADFNARSRYGVTQ